MPVKHPAGSGASPIISKPFKVKSAKSGAAKAPRRKTVSGEATSTQIPDPMKDSPLRTFYALYEHNATWKIAYAKFPCLCRNWSSKAANCVILWRDDPPAYRNFCECQVAKMSEAEMLEVVA